MSTQLPIRCFLSYAHADDDEYGFVHALKRTLEHSCFSECGRKLEIFVDRESIGWGNDWRDKIADDLSNAMVFIPLISLQYFEREACRAELQAFHSAASNLGVTELLLPLIMFGKSRITSESDDQLVRMVERLQHIDIQDAILSGPKTRQWRTTMLDVARKLVATVERAEKIPGSRNGSLPASVGERGDGVTSVVDRHLSLDELDSRVRAGMSNFETQANSVTAYLDELTTIANANMERMKDAPREVVRNVAAELARDIEGIVVNIHRTGGRMETTISEVDAALRRYYSLTPKTQRPPQRLDEQFSELREVMDIMSEFFGQIQPVEVLSAPLRKSLRPLRLGVNSIQVAMATMESWSEIAHQGSQERG